MTNPALDLLATKEAEAKQELEQIRDAGKLYQLLLECIDEARDNGSE